MPNPYVEIRNKKQMIRREYKTLKLFLALTIAIAITWQGKNNLAWFASGVSGQQCTPTWLLLKCHS
ncbi:MAG: hypothetical protein ACRC2V_19340 [Xenococcaceae cyanobacterium]